MLKKKIQKRNFLFLLSDQHRGDWIPYNKNELHRLRMKRIPIRMPNIEEIMHRGVTFTNAITPSPLCAPARACLARGLRYSGCGVVNNQENLPLNKKTYYSVLREHGYCVGSVGKLDLHKPTFFWGLNGWIPDLDTLGFTHAIDNEGKYDAVFSIIRDSRVKEALKKNEQPSYIPKGPYMNYLAKNNLLKIHLNDFLQRSVVYSKTKPFKFFNTNPTILPEEAYCDNWLTKNGIEMLKKFPINKPWHLVVNFTGPHAPWDVTKRMKKHWNNVSFPKPFNGQEETHKENQKIRQNYAAMLENIDRNIGLLIDEVKKRGELDNTIIIYSSDHGEMLGDFNKYGKRIPERGSIKIPLIISGPSISKGMYCDELVELQDLTSTIVDYAEAIMPEAKDSISLKPLLEGMTKNHRKNQISSVNPWKMISTKEYKLIIGKNDKIRLYSLEDDPWESINISKEKPEIVKKLYKELEKE